MAFCNSCGAALTPQAKFCNKCGSAVAGAGSSSPATTPPARAATTAPPAAPKGGSSALKTILTVVVVIVVIGVLGLATLGIIAYRVAKNAHVRQQGDNARVETPFGTVATSSDPEQAVKDLSVDIYPGAQVQKQGTSSVNLGFIHTVTANFTSGDSLDKVCSFYKSRYPAATVATSDPDHCTIVSNDQNNMITINVRASGDTTKFQITSVRKQAASSN